jgi:hypothetical protein
MRRRRFNVRSLLVAVLLGVVAERGVSAQTGTVVEGAPDLILPTGARLIGMGQAAAATAKGSDALWWNPGAVAWGPREFSFGLVSNVVAPASDLTLAFVYPVPRVITFALSLRYLNDGEQPAVDSTGQTTGAFYQSGTTLTATFAAPFGDRLGVGVNLKVLQVGFSCTGACNLPGNRPTTGALDFGARYAFTQDSRLVMGVAVRNVGLPLQIKDAPQADQLPGRIDVGLAYEPRLGQSPGARAILAADAVARLNGEGGPGYRVGGEVSWLNQYFGRAGYVVNGPNGSGPTFGIGLARDRWRVDFAQFLSDFGNATGSKPTYLTLRYIF